MHRRFAASENAFDYLHATKAYLQQWGKPIAFHSDKHGIFRTIHASQKDKTSGLTQFGRALYELDIDIICAIAPLFQMLTDQPIEQVALSAPDAAVPQARLLPAATT